MFRGEIAPGLRWFASTHPPGLHASKCDAGGAAWTLLENRAAAPDYALTGRFWQAPTLTPTVHIARRRLNASERNQPTADYESGRSTTWLMRTYHLGKGTVLNILAEPDVKTQGQGVPADRIEEQSSLTKEWVSLKAVATRMECSIAWRRGLRASGAPVRGRSAVCVEERFDVPAVDRRAALEGPARQWRHRTEAGHRARRAIPSPRVSRPTARRTRQVVGRSPSPLTTADRTRRRETVPAR
jgi:hypothetical protein